MRICQPKAGNNISIVGSGRQPEGPHTQFLYPIYIPSVCLLPSLGLFEAIYLYLADDILAINKPYGLAMFGSSQRHRHSVESLLPGLAKSLGERFSEEMPLPVPVHRLDRITSGILIMAKTPEMHKRLTNLFRERKVSKQYWAILNGTPKPEQVPMSFLCNIQ